MLEIGGMVGRKRVESWRYAYKVGSLRKVDPWHRCHYRGGGTSYTSIRGITRTKFPGATGHATIENQATRVENADQQNVDLVGNWENNGEGAGGVLDAGTEAATARRTLCWVYIWIPASTS
jgi:hypothetical protein